MSVRTTLLRGAVSYLELAIDAIRKADGDTDGWLELTAPVAQLIDAIEEELDGGE